MNYIRTAAAIGVIAAYSASALAQGIIAPGAGPINRSMAGASTAAQWTSAPATGTRPT